MKFNELTEKQKDQLLNDILDKWDSASLYEYVYETMYTEYEKHDQDITEDLENYE